MMIRLDFTLSPPNLKLIYLCVSFRQKGQDISTKDFLSLYFQTRYMSLKVLTVKKMVYYPVVYNIKSILFFLM